MWVVMIVKDRQPFIMHSETNAKISQFRSSKVF